MMLHISGSITSTSLPIFNQLIFLTEDFQNRNDTSASAYMNVSLIHQNQCNTVKQSNATWTLYVSEENIVKITCRNNHIRMKNTSTTEKFQNIARELWCEEPHTKYVTQK